MEHTSNIMSKNVGTFKQMSVCRGCLASDRRMIIATRYEAMYRDMTGLIISPSDGLPQWLCYECSALLEKYVILRNKMIKSHYILYQYVMESVPFAYDENKSSHLTLTSIENFELSGIQAEEEMIIENNDSPSIKLEMAEATYENYYDDNITIEEWRFEDHLDKLASNSSILELKHEKQTEQGETSPHESHVGSEAVRPSLRARLHFEEHIIHIPDPQYADTETTLEYSERVLAEDISRSIGKKDSAQHQESIFEEIYMENVVDKPGVGEHIPDPEYVETETTLSYSRSVLEEDIAWSILERDKRHQPESDFDEFFVQVMNKPKKKGTRVPEKPALATHTRDAEDITSTPFSEDCRDSVKGIIDSDVRNCSNSCSNIQSYYICDKCKKVFTDKILLIVHIRGHSVTEFKPYKCDVCMKCFTKKNYLDTHYRVHTGDKPYKCDVCLQCFRHKSSLNRHYRVHTGIKPYKCDVCTKIFSRKGNLDAHHLIHTGDKSYKCDVCTKIFSRKGNLDAHHLIHTGDKSYKCDVCTKIFTLKGNLDTHNLKHTGDKPYKCDVCLQYFRYKCNLDIHYRVHTGNKPYKCDVCTKRFSRKENLVTHHLIHTGDKPYKCDVCTKRFGLKGNLDAHYRLHTGDKPYKCDVCLQRFRYKSTLNTHYRGHTGD